VNIVHFAPLVHADAGAQQLLLTPGHTVSDRQLLQQDGHLAAYDGQQENQLLLVDLVSFDHCQEVSQHHHDPPLATLAILLLT
jgi:hypothetical protein